jgi:2-isopropylmalate synthase
MNNKKKNIDLEIVNSLRDKLQNQELNLSLDQKIEYIKLNQDFFKDMLIEVSYASESKDSKQKNNSQPFCIKEYATIFSNFPNIKDKISTFGSTYNPKKDVSNCKNIKDMLSTKADITTIFGKTWKDQIKQLNSDYSTNLTSENYLTIIHNSISYLLDNPNHRFKRVIYDAEHYFTGLKDDIDYALQTLYTAANAGADTLVLCDTIGTQRPKTLIKLLDETFDYKFKNGLTLLENFPDLRIGIHCHNDKNHADSNTITFVEHITEEINHKKIQIQGTIHGKGERVGNADLTAILPQIDEDLGIKLNFNKPDDSVLDSTNKKSKPFLLKQFSDSVANLCRYELNDNLAYVGKLAFAHKAGMHLYAIMNGSSYLHTNPDKWGNKEIFLFSSMAGENFIRHYGNSQFGFDIKKGDKKLKNLISELKLRELNGSNSISYQKAEQFLLYNKFFGMSDINLGLSAWNTTISYKNDGDNSYRRSETRIYGFTNSIIPHRPGLTIDGTKGPVDTQFEVYQAGICPSYPCIKNVLLENFKVRISEYEGTKSKVINDITFIEVDNSNNIIDRWEVHGISENILESSMNAIEKGFKYKILK